MYPVTVTPLISLTHLAVMLGPHTIITTTLTPKWIAWRIQDWLTHTVSANYTGSGGVSRKDFTHNLDYFLKEIM